MWVPAMTAKASSRKMAMALGDQRLYRTGFTFMNSAVALSVGGVGGGGFGGGGVARAPADWAFPQLTPGVAGHGAGVCCVGGLFSVVGGCSFTATPGTAAASVFSLRFFRQTARTRFKSMPTPEVWLLAVACTLSPIYTFSTHFCVHQPCSNCLAGMKVTNMVEPDFGTAILYV